MTLINGKHSTLTKTGTGLLLGLTLLLAVGCSEPANFKLNLVAIHKVEIETKTSFDVDHQTRPIAESLEALFGTPDNPYIAPVEGIEEVLDIEKLQMAAGPYGSDEDGTPRGLYRQHCAHCHGVTGDGAGPTATFLNPYPRDYRLGKFKFKSTTSGPPTHDDLKKIILEGVTGTAMPSFKLLDDDEVEALTHYVKYLTIRGEVERTLFTPGEDLYADLSTVVVKPSYQRTEKEEEEFKKLTAEQVEEEKTILLETLDELKSAEVLKDVVASVVSKWASADEKVLEIKAKPEMDLEESIAKGRELFFSATAACSTCHGDSGLGDGQSGVNFTDDWTKEYFNPEEPEQLAEFLALGALEPRQLKPRNLRQGVFRGGRRPIDIFWRIRVGIQGTGMPAAAPSAVSDEDVWHLVDFVRYGLPYDGLSRPQVHKPENARERN